MQVSRLREALSETRLRVVSPLSFVNYQNIVKLLSIDLGRCVDSWLFGERKDSVVLYVAHDNEPAERAYHRVGFGGLCGTPATELEVEDWLEVGFKNTEMGHW